MTTIPGVGPQLARAAAKALIAAKPYLARPPSGPLRGPFPFARPATETERTLLTHLGFELPEQLTTAVSYPSSGVRRRRWPQLETEENQP